MSTNGNHNGQLKSIVERLENLNEQIDGLKDDAKEIYAEAKSGGFDPKIIRAVIKRRKESEAERDAREELIDTYMNALGQLAETPLGKAAIERAVA